MSLYNALFGTNSASEALLHMLGKTMADFGRFRDAYLNEDGSKIIVYTRCGGGNREAYQDVFDEMMEHPNYITSYDDDFDCTYAYFEFSVPAEYVELLKNKAAEIGQKQSPSEKMQQLIADMSSGKDTPEVKNALDVGKKIFSKIDDATKEGGNNIIEI